MRRVIKFRAWNKHDSKMSLPFTFSSLLSDIAWYDVCEVWLHYGDGLGDYWVLHEPYFDDDNWSLMQFTGLTDKNGKEIYEGDIVNINNPANTGEIYGEHTIIFHEGCFMIDRRYSYAHVPLMTYALISEVIGNIYQNGDLLNG